ncbi:hypothetical protein OIU85_020447 [Salix viminalis]|uniref:Uncharacterized protein n=1 Tax=Salix viminalis TaxID=40686 RepID=A0A9Q0ZCK4_SALVM|nr:hypothetical protein OIU85_020447 [Salix viminalis]
MTQLLHKAKQFVAEKVVNVKTPEANITDMNLEGVHPDSIDYGAKVSVSNPYGNHDPHRRDLLRFQERRQGDCIRDSARPWLVERERHDNVRRANEGAAQCACEPGEGRGDRRGYRLRAGAVSHN